MAREPSIGSTVTLEQLQVDPYPIYETLRQQSPIAWIESLDMWMVVNYDDIRTILMDDDLFVTLSEHSTIFDTFGTQMLSAGGDTHLRYKSAHKRYFSPAALAGEIARNIEQIANRLIDGFADASSVELRSAFASRLPIQTILSIYGLPMEAEARIRQWYDTFELALANFSWQPEVRQSAAASAKAFRELIQSCIDGVDELPSHAMLRALIEDRERHELSDEEICRNAAIIFFGGISTVEAFLLNSLWLLIKHQPTLARVKSDTSQLPALLNETMRLMAPVQSATRHVTRDTTFNGIHLQQGDTVNCMLGAANRDPRVFSSPAVFDIDRQENGKHLGFAAGRHHCLGSNLARLQVSIALECLCARLPDWNADAETLPPMQGHEFRQPKTLNISW